MWQTQYSKQKQGNSLLEPLAFRPKINDTHNFLILLQSISQTVVRKLKKNYRFPIVNYITWEINCI